jgi:DNA phosphorothioation-dependent restriction protein DptG
MDFIKSNHNKKPFPIISFFDSVGVNDEQESKKLLIDFAQEILNFDKKSLSLKSFTQKK